MIVKIKKLVYGGKALGKLEDKVCFVPFVLPDEEVEVRIKKEKKSYLECEPVQIINPSPYRVEPPCKYFGYCGGCDYMHISYDTQLNLKKEIFMETLERISGIKDFHLKEIIPSPKNLHYRNKTQLKIKGKKIGFFKKESNEVINLDYCLLLKEDISNLIPPLKEILPFFRYKIKEAHFYSSSEGQITAKFIFNIPPKTLPLSLKHMQTFLDKQLVGYGIYSMQGKIIKRNRFIGSPFAYETVGSYRFRVSADSFFQINRFQIGNLIDAVEKELKEEKAKVIFDLFCGVGTFTIPASKYADKVYGVEINPYAVQDANHNRKINNAGNVFFRQTSASEAISFMIKKNPDLVIVDPPRTGLDKNTVEALGKIQSLKKIIYISCNPSTLARDANLLKNKGFKIKYTKLIDMFPHTYHIESINVFERLNKS